MYCERYNRAFIHNRSCAGASIVRAFGLDPGQAAWHVLNDGGSARNAEAAHRRAGRLRLLLRPQPFDRLVSTWRYFPVTARRPLEPVLQDPPMESHDFRRFTRPQADILLDPATGAPVTHSLMRIETLDADFPPWQAAPASASNRPDRPQRRLPPLLHIKRPQTGRGPLRP
jgi:hypothetical protein